MPTNLDTFDPVLIDIGYLDKGIFSSVESEKAPLGSLLDCKGFILYKGLLRKDWGLDAIDITGTIEKSVDSSSLLTNLSEPGA